MEGAPGRCIQKRRIQEGRSQWLRFLVLQADLPIAWPIEWQAAGQELVEQDTHRVHFAALIHVSIEKFRGHIGRSSHHMTMVYWLFAKP